MHTDHKVPAEFEIADQSCKSLLAKILKEIPALRKNITIPASDSWYSNPGRIGKIYCIKEGMISYKREGKLLFYFNEGDIIGLESLFPPVESTLSTDFAIVVDEYQLDAFIEQIAKSSELSRYWIEYSIHNSRMQSILISIFVNEKEGYVPEVRFFAAGETISEQGSITEEIYTLIEGRADIIIDGQLVGKVLSEEVFGTVAGLTAKPRSSSVVAATDCMVAVIPSNHFKFLIYTRPDTVLKLVEDMARALNAVNEKVVSSSEQR